MRERQRQACRQREKHTEKYRDTDRKILIQTDRQTETERQRDRQRQTETQKQTDRQTDRDTQSETERDECLGRSEDVSGPCSVNMPSVTADSSLCFLACGTTRAARPARNKPQSIRWPSLPPALPPATITHTDFQPVR